MANMLTDINIDGKITANGNSEFSLTNSDDSSITIQQLYNRVLEMIYLYDTNAYKVAIDYEGYYYNSDFYEDSSYQTVMTGVNDKYYHDLTSGYIYQYQTSEYVDVTTDVVVTPNDTKLYIDLLTDKAYRWDGTEFISISGGGGSASVDTATDTTEGILKVKGFDSGQDTLEIGGRNLIFGTSVCEIGASDKYKFRLSESGTISSEDISDTPVPGLSKCIRITNSTGSTAICGFCQDSHRFSIKTGQSMVFSFWIRASSSISNLELQTNFMYYDSTHYISDTFSIDLTTDWKYVSKVLTSEFDYNQSGTSISYIYARNLPTSSYFEVCGLKLEYGTVPTDWSPAPEDTVEKIVVHEYSASNTFYPMVWDNTNNQLFHTTNKLQFNPSSGLIKGMLENSTGDRMIDGRDIAIVKQTYSSSSSKWSPVASIKTQLGSWGIGVVHPNEKLVASYDLDTNYNTSTNSSVSAPIALIWSGTLAQYNAISTKNPNFIYLISD